MIINFLNNLFRHVMFLLGPFKCVTIVMSGCRHNYFAEVFGIIFVVDASDINRIEECSNVLHDLIKHPQVSGKPILL